MKLSRLQSIRLFLTFAVLLSSLSFSELKIIPINTTQWDADGKPIEKADLVIINPNMMIFKANPTISTFQGKNKVEYSTRIFLSVWNRGEKTYRFPTKIDGVGRVDFPPPESLESQKAVMKTLASMISVSSPHGKESKQQTIIHLFLTSGQNLYST